MKKIYYIANARVPTEKAHGLAIMKMCEALARNGVDVELIIPNRKNSIKIEPFLYYGIERLFKINKLWCVDLVILGKIGFWIEAITFSFSVFVFSIFKKGIFYTRDEFFALILKLLSKNIFWESHTAKSKLWISFLKKIDGIIVISRGLRDYYLLSGVIDRKILVSHSGIDKDMFNIYENKENLRTQLSLPINKKLVGYIGKYSTMGKLKGVDEMIESFSLVSSKDCALVVVGVDNKDIKKMPNYCIAIPPVSPRDIPKYTKAMDVLVMNYPNIPHFALHMSPLKLFEYMASGRPIVASDLPSIREILGESDAYFFTPDDAESLASAIDQVLSNYDEAQTKADRSLEKVRKYSWTKRAEDILSFIRA